MPTPPLIARMEQLLNQLKQKPVPSVLRMQNLGLKELPMVPEDLLYRCKKILAINLMGNELSDIDQLAEWLLQFENVEIILIGVDEVSEGVLEKLAPLDQLLFVDDMAVADDISLEDFIADPKYAHLREDYVMVPLPESESEQELPLPELHEQDYTKFLLTQPLDDIEGTLQELPDTVRYVVLRNAGLEYVPLIGERNAVTYLDLRGNPDIQLTDGALDFQAFPHLQRLFIDEAVLAQIGIPALQETCRNLVQVNNTILGNDAAPGEVADFGTVVGQDFCVEVLKIEDELRREQEEFDARDTHIPEEQILGAAQDGDSERANLQQEQTQERDYPEIRERQREEQTVQQEELLVGPEEQQEQVETAQTEPRQEPQDVLPVQQDVQSAAITSEGPQVLDILTLDLSGRGFTDRGFADHINGSAAIMQAAGDNGYLELNIEGNDQLTLQAFKQLDCAVLERIVALNIRGTSIVSNAEQIIQLLCQMPNLLNLDVSIENFDVDVLGSFILDKGIRLQRINSDMLVDDSSEVRLNRVRELQVEQGPEERGRGAAPGDEERELQNAIDEARKMAKPAREQTPREARQLQEEPQERRQLPLKERTVVEPEQHTMQKVSSMLPNIYKQLYDKQQKQELVAPKSQKIHNFTNFQTPDLILIKTQLQGMVGQFQMEIKQEMNRSSVKVPQLNEILQKQLRQLEADQASASSGGDYLTALQQKLQQNVDVSDRLGKLEQFQLIRFETLPPDHKLAIAVQKLNENQELFVESATAVYNNTAKYFQTQLDVSGNPEFRQLIQSIQTLQNGIQELKNYETLILGQQSGLQGVYFKFMSALKAIQQQLIILKNKLLYKQALLRIKQTKSLNTQLLVSDRYFKPRLNLMTKQQIIKLFISAINQMQNKNYNDFISFFNNKFFAINFGKKFEKVKRDIFYESIKQNTDHMLIFAISRCLQFNKVGFFATSYIDLQEICYNLLAATIYELVETGDQNDGSKGPSRITGEEVERQVQMYKVKGIPPKYWGHALSHLDEKMVETMKKEPLSWDEFIGAVMIWKMARVGME